MPIRDIKYTRIFTFSIMNFAKKGLFDLRVLISQKKENETKFLLLSISIVLQGFEFLSKFIMIRLFKDYCN